MQTQQTIKTAPTSLQQITGIAWALVFVIPLLVLAINSLNFRPVFHLFLFLAGWLSWTYTEYFFHRFIMHSHNQQSGLGRLLNHNHHHHDPADIRVSTIHRALMVLCDIALVFLCIYLNDYCTFFCGLAIGFTFYSMMHIMLHHKWSEKLFPLLHQFHIHHHCKYPDKCFGVTFTWWDQLFGTIPEKSAQITGRIKSFYYKAENDMAAARNKIIVSHKTKKEIPAQS